MKAGNREARANRLARLPPGRHGLPRDYVVRNQRDRLAAGTIAVVAQCGFSRATISQISAAAGVSRRTFYTYFSSKEECYQATYSMILEHMRETADKACAGAGDWPTAVAAKLRAALEFFAANPDLARFCLISPQRAGEEMGERYRLAMEAAVAYLCEGMPEEARTPSDAVVASLIGGVAALVVRHVEGGNGHTLPELLPDLLEFFLTPFLGHRRAFEIARG